jgi:hypothetical protein
MLDLSNCKIIYINQQVILTMEAKVKKPSLHWLLWHPFLHSHNLL